MALGEAVPALERVDDVEVWAAGLWIWTGSLLGWAELYRKRSRPDTQLESREFVKQVADILNTRHPVGWPALLNSYR